MSVLFERPIGIIEKQSKFGGREVGLNHPDVPGYVKISDEGDIYIMADDNLGIIINKAKRTVFLVGNVVKFLTNDDDGLKWNQKVFNAYATDYSEPSLVEPRNIKGMYDDIVNLVKE